MTRSIVWKPATCVLAFLLLARGAAIGQTPAPASLPPGVTPCAFDALTNDPDPNGLNVREAPDVHSRILTRLPVKESPVKGIGPVLADFHVIGTKNGWFLIEGASYGGDLDRGVYAGRGWVSGRLITTGLRTETLKSAPRSDAPDVVRLDVEEKNTGFGPDSFDPTAILDCSGKWFRVEMPVKRTFHMYQAPDVTVELKPLAATDAPAGYLRGWTDSYCTAQLTTCV